MTVPTRKPIFDFPDYFLDRTLREFKIELHCSAPCTLGWWIARLLLAPLVRSADVEKMVGVCHPFGCGTCGLDQIEPESALRFRQLVQPVLPRGGE